MKKYIKNYKPLLVCFSIAGSLQANISPFLTNIATLQQLKKVQKSLIMDNWLDYQQKTYGPLGFAENKSLLHDLLLQAPNQANNPNRANNYYYHNNTASHEFVKYIHKTAKRHNLQFENNILHVPFDGYLIPLIAEQRYGDDTLSLEGILKEPEEFAGEEEPCLSLIIHEESLEISFLATAFKACPIPQENGGKFLLKFAKRAAQLFSRDRIELDDLSQLRCPLAKEWVDFRLLSFLSKGKSWYQSHKYIPALSTFEHDFLVDEIHHLSVSSVKEHFSDFDQDKLDLIKEKLLNENQYFEKEIIEFFSSAALSDIQNFLALYKKLEEDYRKENSLPRGDFLLAQLLSWVWKYDCASYIELLKFIFPQQRRIIGVGFNHLIPKGIKYVKYLTY